MTTFAANIPGLIPRDYAGEVKRGFWLDNSILEMFGYSTDPGVIVSGGNVNWRIQTPGTNFAAATVEGAPALAPNVDSVIRMTFALTPFEVDPASTYESIDYSEDGSDPWAGQIAKGAEQLRDVYTTTLWAQFVAAIGAGANYAGQARAGFPTALVVSADAAAVALSVASFNTGLLALSTPAVQQRYVPRDRIVIVMGPALAQRYAMVSNQNVAFARTTSRYQGEAVDGGPGWLMANKYLTNMNFEGIPIYCVPQFAAGTVAMGDVTTIHNKLAPKKAMSDRSAVVEDIRITQKDPAGRSLSVQMDTYGALVVDKPNSWHLMTNKF
jgi:hypothetical protein